MEAVGSCEHCGADAVTAGDAIETEGPDPAVQLANASRWRWFTAIFWGAAVAFELAPVALLLILAANALLIRYVGPDWTYRIGAAALLGIVATIAIAVGSILFKWRLIAVFLWCLGAVFAIAFVFAFHFLAFQVSVWSNASLERSPIHVVATVLVMGLGLACSVGAVFWPVPVTLAGLPFYFAWIVGDLLTNPAAICLTVFRLFLLVGLTIGLGFCIKYR
jgi:hypothetical protein